MRARRLVMAAALLGAGISAATAHAASLYTGPGPRPGPSLLYSKAKASPQLANAGIWKSQPILVSGTTAYRRGEFLYQDYLYDDNGAHLTADPNDPRTAGNLFSKQNGTYTYPTNSAYANNAADFVELRVKPQKTSTAFRVTLNTLKDPKLVAFSIGIGRKGRPARQFPFGANVKAPADLFLTVHPKGSKLVGVLTRASNGKTVKGKAPKVSISRTRRQIDVRVSHAQWNPRRKSVRLWAGVGLWDASAGKYLLPQASADSSHPGGAGTTSSPAAFFNVAFRANEPKEKPTDGMKAISDAAWWRDSAQGAALAANDISALHADVSFAKLARRATDNRRIPKTGAMDRILPSHFEVHQGADFSQSCLTASANCPGQYQSRLQPYAIYIPQGARPARGFGLTLLLHSLSANYNQYLATRNMSQFAQRSGAPSIVITPESRGPDENYENYGAADVFDVWSDVARRWKLNPALTDISGYSMGGIGTFKLGSQFPDLFARAQPTVGDESNTAVLASLRNVPVLMWNNVGDELVNDAEYNATAAKLDSLSYRYELHAHQPCANPACSALFPNHLQLAINDQFAPAAAFLGTATVDRNPARVTYVLDTARNHANLGLVGDHAYWVSGVVARDPSQNGAGSDPGGQIDAFSHGFGASDPIATPTQFGTGQLTGGNLGTINFSSRAKTWAAPTPAPKADTIDVNATNISKASIAVGRAGVDCSVKLNVTSDGAIDIALAGCNRTVHSAGGGSGVPLP
jgi:C-terminal binding-module, SLH-like, of glucodextranase